MDLEVTGSAQTTVVKLKEIWTIERTGELKSALQLALGNSEDIVIDIEELTDTDLCVLQLFCSAHAASVKLGKRLAFYERKSEPFKSIVREAGLVRTIGCHRNPNKNCLWTGDWTS
ncbi:MAG: STAS domain-containing protein [Syntrophobacteraceae bacterium]